MRPCLICGIKVPPNEWPTHASLHVQQSAISMPDVEAYWRDRIGQEILAERIMASSDAYERPANRHYLDGLDLAYDVARGEA